MIGYSGIVDGDRPVIGRSRNDYSGALSSD